MAGTEACMATAAVKAAVEAAVEAAAADTSSGKGK